MKKIAKMISQFLDIVMNMKLFRSVGRLISRLNPKHDVLVELQGYKMYANSLDRIIALLLWKFFALEGYEFKVMDEILKSGMTVLDVGANIGYHTCRISRIVGEDAKVYAFEPDPGNFRLLVKNIEANGCRNVEMIQKAVSDTAGFIKLFFCEEHRGDHRIYDSGDHRKTVEIEAVRLDDLFAEEQKIDVIKIDTQGAEYLVLKGMRKIIEKNQDIILISEFTADFISKCGFDPQEYLQELQNLGFKLRFINEKNKSIDAATIEEIMRMCAGQKLVNLYLSRF